MQDPDNTQAINRLTGVMTSTWRCILSEMTENNKAGSGLQLQASLFSLQGPQILVFLVHKTSSKLSSFLTFLCSNNKGSRRKCFSSSISLPLSPPTFTYALNQNNPRNSYSQSSRGGLGREGSIYPSSAMQQLRQDKRYTCRMWEQGCLEGW